MTGKTPPSLKPFLDRVFAKYHQKDLLFSDPLEFAHRYRDPLDQEAIALLSALFAYGNVKQIRRSLDLAVERIHRLADSPRQFVEALALPTFQTRALSEFSDWKHRFNVGTDLVLLLSLLAESWRRYGTLGQHFMLYHRVTAPTVETALVGVIADWKAWSQDPVRPLRRESSFYFLLNSPVDGSNCKRWCMLLRWMVRKDDLDLGLWAGMNASQLVMPLDTHTGRISQYLGLTERKSLGWKAATEITENLRKMAPEDPVRYDFALARLGILDHCQRKYKTEVCEKCDLLKVCRFARAGAKKEKESKGSR